jgi:aminomethyltransferase
MAVTRAFLQARQCGALRAALATAPKDRRAFATDALKKTLVHDEHVASGGKMVDFAGYSMPVQYIGKKDENPHALSIIESTTWTRSSASLFDVSHMCSIRWKGKDAAAFVERVTTADVHGLEPMKGGLSVIPNARGGIIDDTMVSRCHSAAHGEHVYQVVNAGCAPKDIKHFEEQLGHFGGDVQMEVCWDDRGLFALQGPKAAAVVQRLCPSADIPRLAFGQSAWLVVEGAECLVTRCGYTGEDGFEIFVPGDAAVPVWRKLAGEPEVRLAALGARDALRLEAGLCLYGHDIDEDTTPSEAGLSWVVAKARREGARANFIGHEKILAQVANPKGEVKKLRAGLAPKSGPPAREGASIETMEGEVVGTITSGTMSPVLKKNISMGYINKPFNKKDTELNVVVRGKKYPAVVTKMPFVPTQYHKV